MTILREVTFRQVARNREQTGVSQHALRAALDDFRVAPATHGRTMIGTSTWTFIMGCTAVNWR